MAEKAQSVKDFESEPEASRVFPGSSQAVEDLRKEGSGKQVSGCSLQDGWNGRL